MPGFVRRRRSDVLLNLAPVGRRGRSATRECSRMRRASVWPSCCLLYTSSIPAVPARASRPPPLRGVQPVPIGAVGHALRPATAHRAPRNRQPVQLSSAKQMPPLPHHAIDLVVVALSDHAHQPSMSAPPNPLGFRAIGHVQAVAIRRFNAPEPWATETDVYKRQVAAYASNDREEG